VQGTPEGKLGAVSLDGYRLICRRTSSLLARALPRAARVVIRGRREEVIPSAGRLMGSLRDLGYEFGNAVADLVDNSVSAGASQVDITIEFDGLESWLRIVDNGHGMSATSISEAMRLGSGARDYREDELGKFGLGLKTASLSQARCVTVLSRSSQARRVIDCRQLDLDEVIATNRWEIVHPVAADRPAAVSGLLLDGPGTVVLWTKLDRVLDRNDPWGGWAERRLLALAERLDLHLGMVFGRFLSGRTRTPRAPLTVTINGTKVEPWDPFALDEQTEHLPEKQIPVAGSMIRYCPYVLPSQREFGSDEAWRRASGPNHWNRQQGLYIYRADRMIQSGGWSWLRGQDEHTKLARAAIDFLPELDETFEINISKMRVKLPEELRTQLKPLVSFLTKRAEDRYRKANKYGKRPPSLTPTTRTTAKAPTATHGVPGAPGATVRGGGRSAAPMSGSTPGPDPRTDGGAEPTPWGKTAAPYRFVAEALVAAAERAGVSGGLKKLRDELRRTDPKVAHDLGW
jgi:hypothetical protein